LLWSPHLSYKVRGGKKRPAGFQATGGEEEASDWGFLERKKLEKKNIEVKFV